MQRSAVKVKLVKLDEAGNPTEYQPTELERELCDQLAECVTAIRFLGTKLKYARYYLWSSVAANVLMLLVYWL